LIHFSAKLSPTGAEAGAAAAGAVDGWTGAEADGPAGGGLDGSLAASLFSHCALCAIPGLREAGIDVLKIPVRGTGTSCASCHKPLVAWTKATFSHPSAGEHSYRSFACVKCHPNGYSTAYCSCHGGNPPKGD